MANKDSPNRRDILKRTTALGFASTVGFSGIAGAQENEISEDKKQNIIEKVYNSPEVDQIKQEYDRSDISPKDVKSIMIGSRDDIVIVNISVNDGTLIYSTFDSPQAILIFDERKPNVSRNWPSNTDGFIRATSDNATFLRTANTGEKNRLTNGIGDTKIDSADITKVLVEPKTRTFFVDKYDFENRKLEIIKISSSEGRNADDYEIIEDELFDPQTNNQLSNQSGQNIELLSNQDGCDINNETAADIILCLNQVASCAICSASGVGGPLAVTGCLLAICIGTPTALEAVIDDLDNACVSLVRDVTSCWSDWTSYY